MPRDTYSKQFGAAFRTVSEAEFDRLHQKFPRGYWAQPWLGEIAHVVVVDEREWNA